MSSPLEVAIDGESDLGSVKPKESGEEPNGKVDCCFVCSVELEDSSRDPDENGCCLVVGGGVSFAPEPNVVELVFDKR